MNTVIMSIVVLGLIGLGFSVLLAFLGRKLKVEDDRRVDEILKVLPGINCGACGFSGCRAFAEAVAKKNDILCGCIPGGEKINKKILNILGKDTQALLEKKRIVVCRCGADGEEKISSAVYKGPDTCAAAHILGGVIDCLYGCLALGDCVKVCPTKALTLKDKKIYVDKNKCIGCGKCLKACPRRLFEFTPFKKAVSDIYYVACKNTETARNVKKVCLRGCIGCGICTKVDGSPFYIKDNLSHLDYIKIKNSQPQEEASRKCPTKCILFL